MLKFLWLGLSSLTLFIILAAMMTVAMVFDVLVPSLGIHSHWAFITGIALVFVNLIACTIDKWQRIDLQVLLTHLGVLVILLGGALTWHSALRGKMLLTIGDKPSRVVLDQEAKPAFELPFAVRLDDFHMEYEGEATHYIGIRRVKDDWKRVLKVQPNSRYKIKDSNLEIETGAFIPDLVVVDQGVTQRSNEPRNPAMQVTLIEAGKKYKPFWLFTLFPGQHQEGLPVEVSYYFEQAALKQYVSEVALVDSAGHELHKGRLWVNSPLHYDGWSLYQSGFDPDNSKVSILEAARDPGVPVVYSGFGVLMLGLVAILFRRKT